jgi:hypothetical protein
MSLEKPVQIDLINLRHLLIYDSAQELLRQLKQKPKLTDHWQSTYGKTLLTAAIEYQAICCATVLCQQTEFFTNTPKLFNLLSDLSRTPSQELLLQLLQSQAFIDELTPRRLNNSQHFVDPYCTEFKQIAEQIRETPIEFQLRLLEILNKTTKVSKKLKRMFSSAIALSRSQIQALTRPIPELVCKKIQATYQLSYVSRDDPQEYLCRLLCSSTPDVSEHIRQICQPTALQLREAVYAAVRCEVLTFWDLSRTPILDADHSAAKQTLACAATRLLRPLIHFPKSLQRNQLLEIFKKLAVVVNRELNLSDAESLRFQCFQNCLCDLDANTLQSSKILLELSTKSSLLQAAAIFQTTNAQELLKLNRTVSELTLATLSATHVKCI